jgi:hypothetical protein
MFSTGFGTFAASMEGMGLLPKRVLLLTAGGGFLYHTKVDHSCF